MPEASLKYTASKPLRKFMWEASQIVNGIVWEGLYAAFASYEEATRFLPEESPGDKHDPLYIGMVMELAGDVEDRDSARAFAKHFVEKPAAFSTTKLGRSALRMEMWIRDNGGLFAQRLLEIVLNESDPTYLLIFEGKIADREFKRMEEQVADFAQVSKLVTAGDINVKGGTVSDVTILEVSLAGKSKSKLTFNGSSNSLGKGGDFRPPSNPAPSGFNNYPGSDGSDEDDLTAKLESVDEVMRKPMGDCYSLAAEWVVLGKSSIAGREGGELPKNAKLVQGYPTLQRSPFKKYGHAWIEAGNMVYDATHVPILKMPKAVYYGLGKIDPKDNRYYNKEKAREMLMSCEHYGPWRSGMKGVPPGDPEPEGTYSGEPGVDVMAAIRSESLTTEAEQKRPAPERGVPKSIVNFWKRDKRIWTVDVNDGGFDDDMVYQVILSPGYRFSGYRSQSKVFYKSSPPGDGGPREVIQYIKSHIETGLPESVDEQWLWSDPKSNSGVNIKDIFPPPGKRKTPTSPLDMNPDEYKRWMRQGLESENAPSTKDSFWKAKFESDESTGAIRSNYGTWAVFESPSQVGGKSQHSTVILFPDEAGALEVPLEEVSRMVRTAFDHYQEPTEGDTFVESLLRGVVSEFGVNISNLDPILSALTESRQEERDRVVRQRGKMRLVAEQATKDDEEEIPDDSVSDSPPEQEIPDDRVSDSPPEPPTTDRTEKPLFYRGDLQDYYDTQIISGADQTEAVKRLKAKFKLRQKVEVTPTGEVRVKGIVDNPKPPTGAPPPMNGGGGEEPPPEETAEKEESIEEVLNTPYTDSQIMSSPDHYYLEVEVPAADDPDNTGYQTVNLVWQAKKGKSMMTGRDSWEVGFWIDDQEENLGLALEPHRVLSTVLAATKFFLKKAKPDNFYVRGDKSKTKLFRVFQRALKKTYISLRDKPSPVPTTGKRHGEGDYAQVFTRRDRVSVRMGGTMKEAVLQKPRALWDIIVRLTANEMKRIHKFVFQDKGIGKPRPESTGGRRSRAGGVGSVAYRVEDSSATNATERVRKELMRFGIQFHSDDLRVQMKEGSAATIVEARLVEVGGYGGDGSIPSAPDSSGGTPDDNVGSGQPPGVRGGSVSHSGDGGMIPPGKPIDHSDTVTRTKIGAGDPEALAREEVLRDMDQELTTPLDPGESTGPEYADQLLADLDRLLSVHESDEGIITFKREGEDDFDGFMEDNYPTHWDGAGDYSVTEAKKEELTPEQKQSHRRWERLVNMTSESLRAFFRSPKLQEVLKTSRNSKTKGIRLGIAEARRLMAMKNRPVEQWDEGMWRACHKHIQFIERTRRDSAPIFDDLNRPTRKTYTLRSWGHDPVVREDIEETHLLARQRADGDFICPHCHKEMSEGDFTCKDGMWEHSSCGGVIGRVPPPSTVADANKWIDATPGQPPYYIGPLSEFRPPNFAVLRANQKSSSPKESVRLLSEGHSWPGDTQPAIWEASVAGRKWFVANNHRAYIASSTVEGAQGRFQAYLRHTT